MMFDNIKAVIFDLDGTLLDTREGIYESVHYAVNALGLPLVPASEMYRFIGPPIQESLVAIAGLQQERSQAGADIFRDYYRNRALYKASVYEGVERLLNGLKDCGVKLGVATYKREDYAIDLIVHFGLGRYFDVMHGADNLNRLTKADIIKLTCREIGVSEDEALYVGDTMGDSDAAQFVGAKFVAVNWGFGFSSGNLCPARSCLLSVDYPLQILNAVADRKLGSGHKLREVS